MIPKFRAYSKEENEMYYSHNDKNVDWTIDDETGFIAPLVNLGDGMWGMIDKYELMQSTTLKDKNGVEIFEGDIVLITHKSTNYADTYWHSYAEVFRAKNGAYRIRGEHIYETELYSNRKQLTVAGNIYNSPELLKRDRFMTTTENPELLGTMPKIFAIKADSDDQGWMDSFNGWNDSNYFLNQKIDEKEVELLERKIDKFNHEVACGPAIRLEEQR